WLIYLHGGAWRDPLQLSSTLDPTLGHLSASTLSRVAGLASINYRLSPYPSHPTHPSSPDDPDRNARHPDHVRDVADALAYLRSHYFARGEGEQAFQWVGIGHSCGATLLCQVVSGLGLPSPTIIPKPVALILLAGIFDLGLMWTNHRPPGTPAEVADIYTALLTGAFGHEHEVWDAVSPVRGKYNEQVWAEGREVWVCHSDEDELVEGQQGEAMVARMVECGWHVEGEGDETRVLVRRRLKGAHDDVWEGGTQIAALIGDVVERLVVLEE
ncbi:hypothetical protein EJ04DRAFT_397758, partial [Polyplosphaeria fusca]